MREIVPALPAKGGSAIAIGGSQYEFAAQVTRTVLRQEDDVPFYIEMQSPIAPSKMDPDNSKFKNAEGVGQLPDVADVMNLETGELQVLVVNAVLGSEFQEKYPDHGYVGRLFGVKRHKSEVDKRYRSYSIIEIRRKEGGNIEKVAEFHADVDKSQAIGQKKRA